MDITSKKYTLIHLYRCDDGTTWLEFERQVDNIEEAVKYLLDLGEYGYNAVLVETADLEKTRQLSDDMILEFTVQYDKMMEESEYSTYLQLKKKFEGRDI